MLLIFYSTSSRVVLKYDKYINKAGQHTGADKGLSLQPWRTCVFQKAWDVSFKDLPVGCPQKCFHNLPSYTIEMLSAYICRKPGQAYEACQGIFLVASRKVAYEVNMQVFRRIFTTERFAFSEILSVILSLQNKPLHTSYFLLGYFLKYFAVLKHITLLY